MRLAFVILSMAYSRVIFDYRAVEVMYLHASAALWSRCAMRMFSGMPHRFECQSSCDITAECSLVRLRSRYQNGRFVIVGVSYVNAESFCRLLGRRYSALLPNGPQT